MFYTPPPRPRSLTGTPTPTSTPTSNLCGYNTPPRPKINRRLSEQKGTFHQVEFLHETEIKEMITGLLDSCDKMYIWFSTKNGTQNIDINTNTMYPNQFTQSSILEKIIVDVCNLKIGGTRQYITIKYPNNNKNVQYFDNILANYKSTIDELNSAENESLKVLNTIFIKMEKSDRYEKKGNDETLHRINQASYLIIQPKIDIVTCYDLTEEEVSCIDALVRKICEENLTIDLKISNLGRYQEQLVLFDFMEKDKMKRLHRDQIQHLWDEAKSNIHHL